MTRTLDFLDLQFAHATAMRRRFADLLPLGAVADSSRRLSATTESIAAALDSAPRDAGG
jgi:hypothetical protein